MKVNWDDPYDCAWFLSPRVGWVRYGDRDIEIGTFTTEDGAIFSVLDEEELACMIHQCIAEDLQL